MTLEVLNIKCGGCANTIQKKLSEQFEGVAVDVEAGTVSADLKDDAGVQAFRQTLKKLGYPPADEALGGFEGGMAKAKSFVSCAVGRVGGKQ
jgi:copper chaperone